MTRKELIELYFSDPDANPGLLPRKLSFAAAFADMSTGDQDAALLAWSGSKKASLEAEAADMRAKADEAEATAAAIDAAAKP
jgi:hypothetical protein